MSKVSRIGLTALSAAMSFMLFACTENPSAPVSQDGGSGSASFIAGDLGAGQGEARFEFLEVCKYGSRAEIRVEMEQDLGSSSVTYNFADGECRVLGEFDSRPGHLADFTVREMEGSLPAGFKFDSLRYTVVHRIPDTPGSETQDAAVASTTNLYSASGDRTNGFLVEFFNSEREGGQGCTPGYWKQPHHFDSWATYSPDQPFDDVFENAFPGLSLVEVLELGGGGLNALGRHTVAALLNAASGGVQYDLTPAQVVAQFNAVFPGTQTAYNTLKDQFESFNVQGCPLN